MRMFTRSAALAAALLVSASAAQAQTHVYKLDNSFADALGGPSLVGNAASLSSLGYVFGLGSSLSLSSVFTSNVYTIIVRMRIDNPTANYAKLIDFKNLTTDNGYYSDASGTPDFWDGVTETTGITGAYVPQGIRLTAVTRDAAGLFTVYVNNAVQFQYTDTSGETLFSGPSQIAYFGTDENGNDQGTGRIKLITIFDSALTAQQVADFENGITITATPEPATLTLLATGLLGVFGAARRRRKVA